MQHLLGHLAVLIHRNDQGACFYLSALAVCYDRAAGTLVPRREAASFNHDFEVDGVTAPKGNLRTLSNIHKTEAG
jgi:hypothetical protein